jgi:3-oxoacyl-[acyl-carrier protein] reductase
MTERLKNKVCIITGSGQGIGRGIALAMAKEGARVITNNRRPGTIGGDAKTTSEEITHMGGSAIPVFGDVSDPRFCKKLIESTMDHFSRLDVLVNNAGVARAGTIWNTEEDAYHVVMDSHLKGAFFCSRYASEIMKDQGSGRIISCTSGSWLGTPGLCVYSAAKAGIVGLTRSMAADLKNFGVTCNAYHPFSYSRLVPKKMLDSGPNDLGIIRRRYELGLIDKEEYDWQSSPPPPEAVGPFIAYLASDEASHITGRVFYVSGGKVALYSDPVREKTIFKKEGFWDVDELIEQVPNLFSDKS